MCGSGRWWFGVDAGFLALLRGDRRGCAGQRVVAAAGLREGDDLTNRGVPTQQHCDAVPPERDAAVRWGTELERLQQEPELLVRIGRGQGHHLEHPPLHVGPVDTNGATAHTNDQALSSISPSRWPISSRAAPSSARAPSGSPAAKKTQSPGSAPAALARPSRSASDRFLATGPPSVPSSLT